MSRNLQENFNLSCNIIKNFIKKESDKEIKTLMLKDFLYKGKNIRPIDFQKKIIEVLQQFLPTKEKEIMNKFEQPVVENIKHFDVAIVTIIEPELKAVALTFNLDIDRKEDKNINGIRFWECSIARKTDKRQISCLITIIGEPRNVQCAIGCARMFANYTVDLCVLIGIAGGIKNKVQLGDVVAARFILDFEHQRLEPDNKSKKRPDPFPINKKLDRDLNHFFVNKLRWQFKFLELYKKLPLSDIPFLKRKKIIPNLHQGVIVAGEKLFADGSLPEMREIYHDKIRAVEMEGSGFARICIEYNVPWLVFRGISDFGDQGKKDDWQITAALSASTAVFIFLEFVYRFKDEVEL